MKILGLIPARGGSKGIANKNRKLLGGKPLLSYTIEAALNATSLDSVVFSSEDSKLINLAKDLGVEVPFVRPQELATDTAGSLEVVQHAVKALAKLDRHYDAVCLLQVTSPFRTHQDIDKAITTFKNSQTDSLLSVQEVPHQYNPHWVFEKNEMGNLVIATKDAQIIKRRQDLPPAYIRDGAIYITKTEVLLDRNSFYGTSTSYIVSNPETYVNIDTEQDWERAEQLLANLNMF
ncbi:acylneuraminate cytidylyltransferase family protein [Patiriisocius hiemis]|uniref:Acylneuraminate cytidylyltransferase family protein n=1 Tax=Patiriisocius hiemis TaxID=3075604 RepID=A0ABU2YCZ7_9FLAO|nr:acylneuraminate cytidylyltransferase family protein [Constantimarinum sp. W242]MDT0556043.1 acylneuraminate cytidylyltransferase family protein [Constantimarinum sp. W242]